MLWHSYPRSPRSWMRASMQRFSMSLKGIDKCAVLKLAGEMENFELQLYDTGSLYTLHCKVRHILKSVWVHVDGFDMFPSSDSNEGSSEQVGTKPKKLGAMYYLNMSSVNYKLYFDFHFFLWHTFRPDVRIRIWFVSWQIEPLAGSGLDFLMVLQKASEMSSALLGFLSL